MSLIKKSKKIMAEKRTLFYIFGHYIILEYVKLY